MNEQWSPGDGWRVAEPGEAKPNGSIRYSDGDPRHDVVWWVPARPVPPLPATPFTVIRVTWHNDGKCVLVRMLMGASAHWASAQSGETYSDERIAKLVAGFEVLSEPRAVTAKAVLDRVTDFLDFAWHPGSVRVLSYDLQEQMFNAVRAAFGVKS